MKIPESFIQQLRERCEIIDVVSRNVTLKKRGSVYVGLCPFHSEKTPSFTIYPETQNYYCFGCGAGGDVITFTRSAENVDYVEAIRILAERQGLQIPAESGLDDDFYKRRQRIFEINKEAAKFYHNMLWTDEGTAGREYFENRQLTKNTITRFGLGYAPNSWDSLVLHLTSLGYAREDIRDANLTRVNKNGGYYDNFRNRVMFPILDVRGQIIAFGGRVISKDDEPKYLNSSDTPVFKKSQNLYAFNFAKKDCAQRLILAEGYMDVIAINQAGFSNVVATLGTAITQEQARLMARYTKEVVIAYDSDKAGQAATQKAIQYITDVGLSVKVLKITGGKDPDEFIKTFGADRFRMLLDESENHIEYRFMELMQKYNLDETDGKIAFTRAASEIITTLPNPIEREIYVNKLCQMVDISKDVILAQIKREIANRVKKIKKKAIQNEESQLMGVRDNINREKSKNIKVARAEEMLTGIAFLHQDKINSIVSSLPPEKFITEFGRRLMSSLYINFQKYGEVTLSQFNSSFTVEEMGYISRIFSIENLDNPSKIIDDCIKIISLQNISNDTSKIDDTDDSEFTDMIKKLKK